ncbi:hypothetical protein RGQ15_15110 [Paracoccus sp. MBLB3053]|uniref:Uncharacterized protein n=1 Tax=Paracoccus aurantius TaxID=3073814 RepID=A0ABU2HWC5_9RHOB|nr:hypothetical protein [Paracoccus sp. MBLB3053]MDS9468894.1 hypothetical protein [Paracoccus sp. MBLB3053]
MAELLYRDGGYGYPSAPLLVPPFTKISLEIGAGTDRIAEGFVANGVFCMASDQPSPRRLSRASIVIVAILFVTVIVFFGGRLLWHADELTEDPQSLQAPDQQQ